MKPEQTRYMWDSTTPQWPIMNVVLHGVDRDSLMAHHKSNHIQVVYAPTADQADEALAVKAAMMAAMAICVHLGGKVNLGRH